MILFKKERLLKRVSEIYETNKCKNDLGELYPVTEIMTKLVGKFFWLPVYDLLTESKIINAQLIPTEFFLDHALAVSSFDIMGDDNQRAIESFFISFRGLCILNTLIEEVMLFYPELTPDNIPASKN